METFDFSIRLDDLIVGCLKGGNTLEQIKHVLKEYVDELDSDQSYFHNVAIEMQNA